jgi:hypothetical protein
MGQKQENIWFHYRKESKDKRKEETILGIVLVDGSCPYSNFCPIIIGKGEKDDGEKQSKHEKIPLFW